MAVLERVMSVVEEVVVTAVVVVSVPFLTTSKYTFV
jgi:hypothetical protein